MSKDKAETYDVSVIIPTFRRPHLLKNTILSVTEQKNESQLRFEIIVVDNSPECSAADTVKQLAASFDIPIRYANEPRQNIAHARNAGIDLSDAKFIAMIDDDERAAPDWLDQLYSTMSQFDADVVIGPTTPVFEQELPKWLEGNDDFFNRDANTPTGTQMNRGSSAQFLMRAATCVGDNTRFHPELGRSGGSDTDFFMRLVKRKGCKIVWCNEAKVEEFIPMGRVRVGYLMRRKLRNNQALVWSSTRYSDHPVRTASYLMFVGCAQILIWLVPSFALALFKTPFSVRSRINLMKGLGKLFWAKPFRFNFY